MRNLLIVIFASVVLGACAQAVTPVTGFLYSDVKETYGATSATANTKSGRSCAQSILGWIARGDASVATAKKNAGITTVSAVDYDTVNILGIFAETCTVV